MTSRPNVVITGMGVVSPIGIGCDDYWTAMCERRSGVQVLSQLADTQQPVRIGASVKDFEPKLYVKPRKALKVMSREIQLGFCAAAQATDRGALTSGQVEPERIGVLFGGEMLYCEPQDMVDAYRRCIEQGEFDFSKWVAASMGEMYPLWMLMYLPNMTACHVGISHDARGPNNTICLGEASGLMALTEAAQVIQRGDADVMIAGASSSRISVTPMLYRGNTHLSHRNDAPDKASRPFDLARDGIVNGEGAAAVVLENEAHAQTRGADILARLAGWHTSFGSTRHPGRHEDAIIRSIQGALRTARLDRQEIGHVNAHASGAVDGDPVEAQAIHREMGDVPVTAPKSFFGSLGPAGSMVELIASLLALLRGQVPVTLNYETPDPRCPVRVIHDQPRPVDQPAALVLSQSRMGQTAAVTLQQS